MDLAAFLEPLNQSLGGMLPSLLAALAILIIGWLVAVVVRAVLRKGLGVLGLNRRMQEAAGSSINLESGLAQGAFWLVMLIVLIGVFTTLDLPMVSEPLDTLVQQIAAYLPRIAAAAVLAIVAWALAAAVRNVTGRVLGATQLDDRLAAGAEMAPMSQNVGNVLFWLIILIFTPAILGALELGGLLAPVQSLVDEILAMLPDIFAAAIITAVGWFVAKILRDLVSNLLAAAGTQRLAERVGLSESVSIPKLGGIIVFVFVFVPALIAGLNALHIEAISSPATRMLGAFMDAIPNVFAAIVILTLTYFVARFASQIAKDLTASMGIDSVPEKLGLGHAFEGERKLSDFLGTLIVFFAMLFATVEAANQLGFGQVSDLVTTFIALGGQILLGSVILAVGFWLANVAHGAIDRATAEGSGLANVARVAILALVIAMGLRAMGIADDIVNLAFGLTLGAAAVAAALSFGLGGREAAGRQMEHWLSRMRND